MNSSRQLSNCKYTKCNRRSNSVYIVTESDTEHYDTSDAEMTEDLTEMTEVTTSECDPADFHEVASSIYLVYCLSKQMKFKVEYFVRTKKWISLNQ